MSISITTITIVVVVGGGGDDTEHECLRCSQEGKAQDCFQSTFVPL